MDGWMDGVELGWVEWNVVRRVGWGEVKWSRVGPRELECKCACCVYMVCV